MKAPFKHTPLHKWHQLHGAKFTTLSGWERVIEYGDAAQEVCTIKNSVAIRDVTPLAKCLIYGKHATEYFQNVFSLQLLAIGSCTPAAMNDVGRMSVLRIADDRYIATAGSEYQTTLYDGLQRNVNPGQCVHVDDITSVYAVFHLLGPKAIDVLKRTTSASVEAMRARECLQAPTARVWSLLVRDDIGDLPAWLIFVSRDFGEYVWKFMLAEGADFGITVFGYRAAHAFAAGAFDVAAV